MTQFPVLSLDSAPPASLTLLQKTADNFGFVPNIIGVMAASPALTEAYLSVAGIFAKSNFSDTEQQIVLLTVSHFHQCSYCMAAHTAIANMQHVESDIVDAIRNNRPIPNAKLEALRQFTRLLVENRGWVNEVDSQSFLDAGYEAQHILDILVGITQKTLSNFTNHLAKTPLDDAFAKVAWKAPES